MKRIALVACVKTKKPYANKARYLYDSNLFKRSMQYAEQFEPDQVFILSAKYGLLDPDKVIEPYEVTLNNFSAAEIRNWADGVLADLELVADLLLDHFIILAGDNYRKNLIPQLGSYEVPLEGKTFGKQLQFLKQVTTN